MIINHIRSREEIALETERIVAYSSASADNG
jgi:hypothetical protein